MTAQLLQDPTPDSVGKLLREAREALGIPLENVAKTLCINKRQLAKLESDDESLTCDVYNIGFLRSYAKLLSLNGSELIQQFKQQHSSFSPSQLIFPTPLSKKGMPSFRVLALSLFALASLIIGYEWFRTRHTVSFQQETPLLAPSKEEVKLEKPSSPSQEVSLSVSQERVTLEEASLPPQELIQPVVQAAEVLSVSSPEETPSPPLVDLSASLSPQPILLKVTEESWIEVKDEQGNTIVSRLFHPEETYEFKNSQNFLLKTGNARGIHLISGEKKLTFPGG